MLWFQDIYTGIENHSSSYHFFETALQVIISFTPNISFNFYKHPVR